MKGEVDHIKSRATRQVRGWEHLFQKPEAAWTNMSYKSS